MDMEWLNRVVEEKQMLDFKIKKLHTHLVTAQGNSIDVELLDIQYHCMLAYSNVLKQRIERASNQT